MHKPQIVIFDFGSQFTHLILRQVRASGTYCTLAAPTVSEVPTEALKGIILSGGPRSVTPQDLSFLKKLLNQHSETPVLGICYGHQLLAKYFGHKVHHARSCEYGPETLILKKKSLLFEKVPKKSNVWMSHGDHATLSSAKKQTIGLATSAQETLAAAQFSSHCLGIQFHPEVSHSTFGSQVLKNFLKHYCNVKRDWNPKQIFTDAVEAIHDELIIPKHKALCAVSGGVDSTVLAKLLINTCPKQIHFIHVDHGFGRHQESQQVLKELKAVGIPVRIIQAQEEFISKVSKTKNPERKRKIIGKTFIEIFERYAKKHKLTHLIQGTLYPDRIESKPQVGKSSVIKTHHNVGGIPKNCTLKIVEPFMHFYKDDVRRLGKNLKLPTHLLGRHPFPGPGLAIRILGHATESRLAQLRQCDHILISYLKKENLYKSIWQAGCMLLPTVHSVGVKGDKRVYEPVVAIRCVVSQNAMTAHAARLSIEHLEACASEILNKVPGISRVVYDVSPKPPATIEWE